MQNATSKVRRGAPACNPSVSTNSTKFSVLLMRSYLEEGVVGCEDISAVSLDCCICNSSGTIPILNPGCYGVIGQHLVGKLCGPVIAQALRKHGVSLPLVIFHPGCYCCLVRLHFSSQRPTLPISFDQQPDLTARPPLSSSERQGAYASMGSALFDPSRSACRNSAPSTWVQLAGKDEFN